MRSLNLEVLPLLRTNRDRMVEMGGERTAQRQKLAQLKEKDSRLATLLKDNRMKLDVLNDKSVVAHVAMERQRELIQEELAVMPVLLGELDRAFGQCVRQTAEIIREALLPGADVLLQRGVEALLPFCERGEAVQIIRNTSAFRGYLEASNPAWGRSLDGSVSDGEAAMALQVIDEILAGRNPIKIGGIDLNEAEAA